MTIHLPHIFQEYCTTKGFDAFSPIQEACFQPIINGQSVLGLSPTGSGKTLAYLWPLLTRLTGTKAQQNLILAPNSELAGQIHAVCKEWAQLLGYTSQLFVAGSSQKRQIERLKKGPQIIIGTPGRVWELVALKKIKMMQINTIVLDECDALLSDSQANFVTRILRHAPKDYQMIYMSATSDNLHKTLSETVHVVDCLSGNTMPHCLHYYLKVDKRDRIPLLRKLSRLDGWRALVFFNHLSDLGACEDKLVYHSVPAISLASDVAVTLRQEILRRFKNHDYSLLLTTDILSRGIDISDLEIVINMDLPTNQTQYIHRSGRTGRMGKEGIVITFISQDHDLKQLQQLSPAPLKEIIYQNGELLTVD